jgi:Ti-type conjugative transfer relaxase TraA
MLSIGGGNAWYYANLAERDDYYQRGAEPPGLWHGKGAEEFGFEGEVSKQDFYALCAGYDIRSGEKLVHHAGTDRRRALWDFTFSAPKGVSVWWGMTDEETRERLSECQLRAVKSTLDYAEERGLVGTRKGGSGKEIDPCHKLTWALYEHSTSREQDAELHTHAVLVNVGINPDGQTRTLDPAEAVRQKMLLGAIYRAELSRELQREFGVEIERLPKGMYDIKGVPEDLKADHSTRRRQILDAMEREGASGGKAASAFVLTTRKVKEYVPREELFKEWAERGREYGLDEREIAGRREFDPPTREQTKESLSGVLDQLTKDKAYFTEASLLKGLAVEAQYSGAGFAHCREVGEEYLEKQAVHLGMEKGQKLYTTPEIDRLEKRMLAQVIEGRSREFPALRPSSGLVNLSGISEEQRSAVEHLTEATGSVKIVSGMAGAGKTTMLKSAREVWEARGYQVQGVALAAVAAQGLENEAKIPSQTIAKLFYSIDHPQKDARPLLDDKTVLVVDEAGMVGTLQMARLVEEAEKAGAKLALVGDERQLQPIEHGAPFKTFGALLGKVELKEIRRQREDWQREAVHDFADGRAVEGLTKYLERGLLTITEKRGEAVSQMVDAWSKDPADYPDKIMMGSTRAAVNELNRLGQGFRIERGELGTESVTANGYDFHAGDRILFRKNDRRLGVLNGEKATVREIDAKSETLIARMDGGELRVIPLQKYDQVQLGYAFTTHAEQGDTREKSFVLVGGSMQDRELSYVQMSRHRAEARIFTSIEDAGNSLEALAEVMSRSRQKELAQEKREQGMENAPAAAIQEKKEEISQEHPSKKIDIDRGGGFDFSM